MNGFVDKVMSYLVVSDKSAKNAVKEPFEGTAIYYASFLVAFLALDLVSSMYLGAILGPLGGVSTVATIVSTVFAFIGMLVLAFVLSLLSEILGKKVSFDQMFAALVYSNTIVLVTILLFKVLAIIPGLGLLLGAIGGLASTLASIVAVYFFFVVLTKGVGLDSGKAIILMIISFVITAAWGFLSVAVTSILGIAATAQNLNVSI